MGAKESFGFGILDNYIFLYAVGTFLAGVGFIIIMSYYWKFEIDPISGLIIFIVGVIIANIAHSKLKKTFKK